MTPFWPFARQLLRYPWRLATAMVCAVLAASGLGVGIASMVPLMRLMLGREGEGSLRALAQAHNDSGAAWRVPAAVIEWLPTDPYRGVLTLVGGLAILAVVGAIASFLRQYLSMVIVTTTVTRIRQAAFRHVLHLPLVRVQERGPSEFVSRIVRDTVELQRGLNALLSKAVVHTSRGLACLVVAIVVSWEVAVTAPIVGVVVAVLLKKLGRRIRRGTHGSLEAQERLLRIATESVQGLRFVKASTGERHANLRFHRENLVYLAEEWRARIARALSTPIMECLATFIGGGLAAIFAARILRGAMTFEEFVVALGALGAAGSTLKPMSGVINEIQSAAAPAKRLEEIFGEPRENERRRPAMARHHRDIEFDRVRLVYPAAERPSLDGVSLRIEFGQRVAIVGANGSGKTTLVSLLPRLLRPQSGRLLIDGVDVESVGLRSLRRQIGVVTQETVLFRGSVAENLAFGTIGSTRESIIEAARRATAHEIIERLPGGYDANIAEQGASLSGGERQRLAIARALLRDPAILILDEATSQVDAESEVAIGRAVERFCKSGTAIIIAHRLSTVQSADRIFVLDAGRLVGEGSHEALMESCPTYGELAKTQLART